MNGPCCILAVRIAIVHVDPSLLACCAVKHVGKEAAAPIASVEFSSSLRGHTRKVACSARIDVEQRTDVGLAIMSVVPELLLLDGFLIAEHDRIHPVCTDELARLATTGPFQFDNDLAPSRAREKIKSKLHTNSIVVEVGTQQRGVQSDRDVSKHERKLL